MDEELFEADELEPAGRGVSRSKKPLPFVRRQRSAALSKSASEPRQVLGVLISAGARLCAVGLRALHRVGWREAQAVSLPPFPLLVPAGQLPALKPSQLGPLWDGGQESPELHQWEEHPAASVHRPAPNDHERARCLRLA